MRRKFMVKLQSDAIPFGPYYAFSLKGARKKALRKLNLKKLPRFAQIWEEIS